MAGISMAREYMYFLSGMLLAFLLSAVVLSILKLKPWEPRPDQIITYKKADQQGLKLHAFFADSNSIRSPAIVLFHGGRWLYGAPEAFYPQCRFFAQRGISCFSAEYRLGYEGKPRVREAVQDARDALRYLREHADALNIDPNLIAAGGGSSGGHLAAMLGVAADKSDRPFALVLYCPMLDLSPGKPDHHMVADHWQEVSPLHLIDSETPVALIMVGTEDLEVPIATVDEFCSLAKEAGISCLKEEYSGQGHGFFNYKDGKNPFFERTNERAFEFLSQMTESSR